MDLRNRHNSCSRAATAILAVGERTSISLRTKLSAGCSVSVYSGLSLSLSGHSMYPMVQSGDVCTFHPIQAVTAEGQLSIQKERSEIGVGDIVFCQVQPSLRYYAHIVRAVLPKPRQEYSIGNIQRHIHGWCYRENIFGILVDVQVLSVTGYYSRPLPKTLFEEVSQLVGRARDLCLPLQMAPSSGAQSRG